MFPRRHPYRCRRRQSCWFLCRRCPQPHRSRSRTRGHFHRSPRLPKGRITLQLPHSAETKPLHPSRSPSSTSRYSSPTAGQPNPLPRLLEGCPNSVTTALPRHRARTGTPPARPAKIQDSTTLYHLRIESGKEPPSLTFGVNAEDLAPSATCGACAISAASRTGGAWWFRGR